MTINCKGTLVDLSKPKVMGILNLTPDSFYDGGKYKNEAGILNQVEKMLFEGASFIDIGAYSSRPGAEHISEEEELSRITPIVEVVLKKYPSTLISIDTFRSNVASECIQIGAVIINDISAGKLDENMLDAVAKHQVPYIMMHMRGNPQNMKEMTDYDDLLKDILYYFSERVATARTKKINDVILDPGFGFAKTIEQNFELLANLNLFQNFDLPILAGLSRKSMIYKLLDTTPENALNGTTALHMSALAGGANFLRVHDVKEAMECVVLFNELNTMKNS
ncbi:dihydropteroate synthase [Croceitalea sp. MTPC9]|uniref:dihydropteroate synthase n=1 Tax=unclassified Croceitalea TaxID=2632280 RepID=UPI002B364BDE|nr:dihydropteroate synthase [Croceitalea sp. MTPC6]GMN18104.1 dihydropteroate synthase [Croceitalea sp. MTPC9]